MKIGHLIILTILALIFIPLVRATTFVPGSVSADGTFLASQQVSITVPMKPDLTIKQAH